MSKPVVSLPKDQGLHKDPVEWWYWTAQGTDRQGHEYAVMFALFKVDVIKLTNVFFAHWFISEIDRKKFRPHTKVFWRGLDTGSFENGSMDAWSGKSFRMDRRPDGSFGLKTPQFGLDLKPLKPTLLVGGTGFIDLKSSTTVYYSHPRLEATGHLRLGNKKISFKGLAWMDHQWSPITFNREHAWTWFSFQLTDGTDFQCFEYGWRKKVFLATVSWPDGSQQIFKDVKLTPMGEPWVSPASRAKYFLTYTIEIPSAGIRLSCGPKINDQEMVHGLFRYWEGPLWTHGSVKDRQVTGNGFLELNGVPSDKSFGQMLRDVVRR